MMVNARGHLSSETIDLLLLAALEPRAAGDAQAHLDGCDTCRTRWQEVHEDRQRFEHFVFARTLPKIEARVAKQRRWTRFPVWWLIPSLGLAAAVAVAVAVISVTGGQPSAPTEDGAYLGLKGQEPALEVFARRGGGAPFAVRPGASLRAGDQIRFVVSPGSSKFLLIASRDGKGTFSVYHPFGATQSQPVSSSGSRRVELPGSVQLDETLGREELVVVLSDQPVKAADVEAALKVNPGAPQVAGARVITWEFVKGAP